ncbi:MAG: hypothetical protein C0502_09565 [Opitutus sp.]|nr:hypothetical protein [Opitutus sp.]
MKTPFPPRRLLLLAALLPALTVAAATATRDEFLAAKQSASAANFRNDRPGLEAAVSTFARLAGDHEWAGRARYHAAWCEWMIAATHFQDQKPAEAVAVLESGVARLRQVLAESPDDAEAHALLGWMLMAVGSGDPKRFPELAPLVRTHRGRALELAPRNPRAVMLDATLLCYSPKPETRARGFARWQETLELIGVEQIADPTQPDWGRTLADGWLANLILILDPARPGEARAHAEKALREQPDWWWVRTQVLAKLPPAG